MGKITLQNLSFSYSKYFNSIFSNVSLVIDTSWKLGLVGRNGRGKTTLLQLINGNLIPESGQLFKNVNTEIFCPDIRVDKDWSTLRVIKEKMGSLYTIEKQLQEMQNSNSTLHDDYYQLLDLYEKNGGYNAESSIHKEFYKMGLCTSLLNRKFSTLSGGEKSRVLIISLFLKRSSFILFDEPTNHLDSEGRQYVADYLANKKGFIVVTHDRVFLDTVCDHILSINKANIYIEKGNYSSWEHNKNLKDEYEKMTKQKLQKQITQLEKEAKKSRVWASSLTGKKYPFATHSRCPSSRQQRHSKKAKRAEQKILKNINVKKTLLKNYETTPKLVIKQKTDLQGVMLKVKDLYFSYGSSTVLNGVSFELRKHDRLWVKGNNGSGKSTLLNLICNKITSYQGLIEKDENALVAFSEQEPVYKVNLFKELINNIQLENKVRYYLQLFDISSDHLDRPLNTWSSGEIKKLEVARALAIPNNILLFDEPLNYSDVYFVRQLEKAILQVKPTLIFVEHDEQFGNSIATNILEI